MSSIQGSDEIRGTPDRTLRHGLAKKLAAFAFVSAFVTSLAVTWAAIDSTQHSLNDIIQREVPAALRRVAQQQVRWFRSGERNLVAFGSNLTDRNTRPEVGDSQPTPVFISGADRKVLSTLLSHWIENSSHFRGGAILHAPENRHLGP